MKKTIIAFIVLFALLFIWDRMLKNQQKYSAENKISDENLKSVSKNHSKPVNENETFKKAPDFTLTSLNKNEIKLSNYKGKVVILDFWATWCPPCRAEIPFFIELYKQYKEEGLVIIGMAIDEKYKVEKFAKDFKINYPVVIGNEKIANDYGGIHGLPTTFIIDKEGNIREKFVGYRPKEVFEEAFKKLK
ncbi:MAG: TlpA family protein disulfide reductase [Candidatus Goldbacteria bacterium]|nr:TlpA family protein disulfide reductase [Candidatus Goldiibacteriota bacterium]